MILDDLAALVINPSLGSDEEAASLAYDRDWATEILEQERSGINPGTVAGPIAEELAHFQPSVLDATQNSVQDNEAQHPNQMRRNMRIKHCPGWRRTS